MRSRRGASTPGADLERCIGMSEETCMDVRFDNATEAFQAGGTGLA